MYDFTEEWSRIKDPKVSDRNSVYSICSRENGEILFLQLSSSRTIGPLLLTKETNHLMVQLLNAVSLDLLTKEKESF